MNSMKRWPALLATACLMTMGLAGPALATSAAATPAQCVPSEAWTETVVDTPASTIHHDATPDTFTPGAHHDAVLETFTTVNHPAETHVVHHDTTYVTSYEYSSPGMANMWMTVLRPDGATRINGHSYNATGVTRQDMLKAAWDETVVDKAAWSEQVGNGDGKAAYDDPPVNNHDGKAAWDETVPAVTHTVNHEAVTCTEQVRWVVPASAGDPTNKAGQESTFPQTRLVGDLKCGSWSQDDTYILHNASDLALFNSLGDTLTWVNGRAEDAAIYQSHTFTYGGDCQPAPKVDITYSHWSHGAPQCNETSYIETRTKTVTTTPYVLDRHGDRVLDTKHATVVTSTETQTVAIPVDQQIKDQSTNPHAPCYVIPAPPEPNVVHRSGSYAPVCTVPNDGTSTTTSWTQDGTQPYVWNSHTHRWVLDTSEAHWTWGAVVSTTSNPVPSTDCDVLVTPLPPVVTLDYCGTDRDAVNALGPNNPAEFSAVATKVVNKDGSLTWTVVITSIKAGNAIAPPGEGDTYVLNESGQAVFTLTTTNEPCPVFTPTATITEKCVANGGIATVVIDNTTSNIGEDFSILVDGVMGSERVEAGATGTFTYSLKDGDHSIVVNAGPDGVVIADKSFTVSCAVTPTPTPSPTTTTPAAVVAAVTPAAPAVLAQTGSSDTSPLLAAIGLLFATGGALLITRRLAVRRRSTTR